MALKQFQQVHIVAIQDQGRVLVTTNLPTNERSTWRIKPEHAAAAKLWVCMSEIIVGDSGNTDYPYWLTNEGSMMGKADVFAAPI